MNGTERRLAAAALAVATLLGACGAQADGEAADLPSLASNDQTADTSATDGDGDEPGEVSEADQRRAEAEWEACMADLGIDVSSSSEGDGASVQEFEIDDDGSGDLTSTPEAMDEAFAECDDILEEVYGSFELSPEQEAELADQNLELQRCMNEQGFDLDLEGQSGAIELGPDEDFEAFEAAIDECASDLDQIEAEGEGQ